MGFWGINLIMLLGDPDAYPWMFRVDGMSKLANFADGI